MLPLIGGNYTNVTSDIGACIAAGGTLHLVNQGRKRQRADAERLTLLRRYTRSCTTCTPPQRPIPGRLPANPARTDGRQSKSSSQHGPTTEASLLAPTNSLSTLTARPGRVVGGQVMTRLGQGDPAPRRRGSGLEHSKRGMLSGELAAANIGIRDVGIARVRCYRSRGGLMAASTGVGAEVLRIRW